MRLVVVGASGNVGTSLLRAIVKDGVIDSVVGICRRVPRAQFAKTTWVAADIARDDLAPHFRGADCIVHLAWQIQPSRDLQRLWQVNVEGSTRVFEAVRDAGVSALVYASSVGAYSPGPKDRLVDESWPTEGVPTSFYARHKAEVERRLDRFEQDEPSIRVVRLRPALTFKRESASGQRRLFAGPFLPSPLVRRAFIPFVPNAPGLTFQAVHSLDVGEAYRLAATSDARGAFNVAADPVIDSEMLADILDARLVSVSPGAIRGLAALTWRLHLQPTPPGWVDLAFGVPLLDPRRAREELGWTPRFTGTEALLEVLEGIREGAGIETPPLSPRAGGPARVEEVASGVGERE
jgi:nucleoside-diphosphate-sugar epimerase